MESSGQDHDGLQAAGQGRAGMSAAAESRVQSAWMRWTGWFLMAALAVMMVLWGFAAALDPFGLRVRHGQAPRPIMDINQRYMYPQLVRSGAFDSAVFGTSTMRLLDPATLSHGIGGGFANLAMNAATPWEQLQMAQLFAGQVAAPRAVLWGIDSLWCAPDATDPGKRLTPRSFPPWLYDEIGWRDWPQLMNLTTLEIAARLLAHRLGFMKERIRGDGYEVFTPPEALYDVARARMHLYADRGGLAPDPAPLVPAETVGAGERAGWRYPALAWLDQALSRFPPGTKTMLVLPPAHYAMMPREGTADGQRYAACKSELAAVAARHGAILVDYAIGSPITRRDDNYWDRVHFRLPIARRMEAELAAIAQGAAASVDGSVAVTRPAR